MRHGALLAGLLFTGYVVVWMATTYRNVGYDAFAYWSVDLGNLYRGQIGGLGWFAYSPAVAQVASPFQALPWATFLWLWLAGLVATVIWLGREHTLWLLAFPPVALEIYHGNVNLLIAAAIVLGFRYPAAWAFVLLTKVTPGIGLLWFAVRREWRSLALALGTTLIVAGASFAFAPHLWAEWVSAVTASSQAAELRAINVPLALRLPLAVAVVVWGARTDRAWTVPVAATLAMPVLWLAVLSTLAAALPLRRRGAASDVAGNGSHASGGSLVAA